MHYVSRFGLGLSMKRPFTFQSGFVMMRATNFTKKSWKTTIRIYIVYNTPSGYWHCVQCYAFRLSEFFFDPKFFCSPSKFDSKILFNLFNEIDRVIAFFNQQSINRNEEQLILVASCDYLKFFRFYLFHDFDFSFFFGLNFFMGFRSATVCISDLLMTSLMKVNFFSIETMKNMKSKQPHNHFLWLLFFI